MKPFDELTLNEQKARMFRLQQLNSEDGKPEGTRESLETCARMLDTYGPELYPANEFGQVSFSRAMMESVADNIRAFLDANKAPDTTPPEDK